MNQYCYIIVLIMTILLSLHLHDSHNNLINKFPVLMFMTVMSRARIYMRSKVTLSYSLAIIRRHISLYIILNIIYNR